MPQVQRYSNILRGAIIYTGNTLGFSSNNAFGIGAYLSTTSGQSVPSFPTPSTQNWTQNGSTAVLNIPPGCKVEYAELVWGGSTLGEGSPASNPDTTITFITPNSTTTIAHDPVTAQSSTSFGQTFYTRSKIVTDLVTSGGSGTYEAKGISATLEPSPSSTSAAGWVLCVIVSRNDLPYQSMTFYVSSISSVSGSPVNTTFTGFTTPFTGTFSSRVLITALEGNAGITGDFCSLGANSGSLTNLSGPNNQSNNFFQSQVNNGNYFSPNVGQLDTSGSFGNLNQPTNGSQNPFVRSGFDLTNVPGTPLPNGTTSAVLSIGTSGDAYAVTSFAFQVDVNTANLSAQKSVDKANAVPGDTIKYTITLRNTGNYTASNVLFSDTIPQNTTFNNNSFNINNTQISGANPGISPVTIPDIGAGGAVTLSFLVTVIENPVGSKIFNSGLTSFIGLLGATIPDTLSTNVVETRVINLSVSTNKTVDKTFTKVGDTLIYSVSIKNNSNVALTNVTLVDTNPNGAVFVNGSVKINSVSSPTANPNPPGILLNSLPIGGSVTISFSVNITSTPKNNAILNSATFLYGFEGSETSSLASNTNTVKTDLGEANLDNPIKYVDKTTAGLNDILTYTIAIKNSGNYTATNILFRDTIPSSTTFVFNTFSVNGTLIPMANPSMAPIMLPDIKAFSTATIQFNVRVSSLPTINPLINNGIVSYSDTVFQTITYEKISNNVETNVFSINVSTEKFVSKLYVGLGETITYTISITNTGNVPMTNVKFVDTIPKGATFVGNSVLINGVSQPGLNPNPPGFSLNTLPYNQTLTISFLATITTVPNENPIKNIGIFTYQYRTDALYNSSIITNPVLTNIRYINLNPFEKYVDKLYATSGDILTYTLLIRNTGNIPALNVFFTDTIGTGVMLVQNSVLVNGLQVLGANPLLGFNIPNIEAKGVATINFKVLVL